MEDKFGKKEFYPCATPGCSNIIPFSERDKEFYILQGWTRPNGTVIKPKRCKACRAKRKVEFAAQEAKRKGEQEDVS